MNKMMLASWRGLSRKLEILWAFIRVWSMSPGGLPNNGHLNHVLELARVAYGSRPMNASAEVLKKRKAEASGKFLAKRLLKKSAEHAKVSGACAKGGLK
jgi:hypothetical protein